MRCLHAACVALVMAFAAIPISAQTIPDSEFRDSAATVVVYYLSNNDPRPFELNLAIAEAWPDFAARDIDVLDAGPRLYDSGALARQFELPEQRSFAAILVDRSGRVVFTAHESDVVNDLLDAFDQAEDR